MLQDSSTQLRNAQFLVHEYSITKTPIREHELSVKEELALAEGYAHDGPDE